MKENLSVVERAVLQPDSFIEKAAAQFLMVTVTVAFWRGRVLNQKAATDAASAAQLNYSEREASGLTAYSSAMGKHESQLKYVNAKYQKVRDYVYKMSIPATPKVEGRKQTGPRLIPVTRFADLRSTVSQMRADAEQSLEEFLTQYDRYVQEALETYSHWYTPEMFKTKDELRSAYQIDLSNPRTLQPQDLSRTALSGEDSERIYKACMEESKHQLEAAWSSTLDDAVEQIDRVIERLQQGTHMREGLINDTKLIGEFLKSFGSIDPRFERISDDMLNKVVNVPNLNTWRDSPAKKQEAIAAATKVQKDLKAMTSERKATAPKPGGKKLFKTW